MSFVGVKEFRLKEREAMMEKGVGKIKYKQAGCYEFHL